MTIPSLGTLTYIYIYTHTYTYIYIYISIGWDELTKEFGTLAQGGYSPGNISPSKHPRPCVKMIFPKFLFGGIPWAHFGGDVTREFLFKWW